jgi:hypothetical protein
MMNLEKLPGHSQGSIFFRRMGFGAGLLLAGCCLCASVAYSRAGAKGAAAPGATRQLAAVKVGSDQRNWRNRESLYYKRNWGVEIIGVKPVSSGYRVLDPDKVKLLNDRKSRAYLRDEASGTVLAVPAMENVGELRSGSKPELNRIYFMIFGNPGKLVKSGSRVAVIVGDFHVDGLIVD